MDNPLLTPSDLPPFDRIGAQDVAPAIDVLLERASQALETVTPPPAARHNLHSAGPPPPRHCGPPTTPPCRASPNSGPAWAPTSGCTPSTRPSTPRHSRPCKATPTPPPAPL